VSSQDDMDSVAIAKLQSDVTWIKKSLTSQGKTLDELVKEIRTFTDRVIVAENKIENLGGSIVRLEAKMIDHEKRVGPILEAAGSTENFQRILDDNEINTQFRHDVNLLLKVMSVLTSSSTILWVIKVVVDLLNKKPF
jgi:hypothetical protein